MLLLDQAALDDAQADIQDFDPGHAFTFSSMDLTITAIERIVLTTEFGFTDVSVANGIHPFRGYGPTRPAFHA